MERILTDPAEGIDGTLRRKGFDRELLMQLDALYTFALRLSRNPHDAEDLVSATVVRALEHWTQYEPGTNARAWLFTILYRLFVSQWRHRRTEVSQRENEDGEPIDEVVGEADPEGRFYDSIIDDEITRAIEALPEEYRAAVVLSDVHGLRYAELAEVLGVPEGTVKSRLFRGRRILRRRLAQYATEYRILSDPGTSSARAWLAVSGSLRHHSR